MGALAIRPRAFPTILGASREGSGRAGGQGASTGSPRSAIFTQQSLILTKQPDFFLKTWFQDGNNQTASLAVSKNTLVPKTLFSLKGQSLDAPARGTAGCSESVYWMKSQALTHPLPSSCTQLPACSTAPVWSACCLQEWLFTEMTADNG